VYLSPTFRPLRILEFPFLFDDMNHFWRFYAAAQDKLTKLYAEKGIKYLGETGYPWYGIWNSKKPINKMEDWKGMKIRAGGVQKLAIESWGASGVMIASAELPTSLQQGMVDGGIHTPSLVADTPLYPYLKYGSSPFKYVFYGSVPQLMSLKTWNALPPEIQKIIEKKVTEEVLERSKKLDQDITGERYKKIESGGVKLSWFAASEIEKMLSTFKPVLEKQLSEMGPVARDLYEIVTKTRSTR